MIDRIRSSRCPFGFQLLNVGKADFTVENKEGQTALVKGYMLLYKQPPESCVRAVVMLAQVAGVTAVKEARRRVDGEVQKLLKPSSSSGSSSSDDRPLTAFAHSPVSHATIVTRSS